MRISISMAAAAAPQAAPPIQGRTDTWVSVHRNAPSPLAAEPATARSPSLQPVGRTVCEDPRGCSCQLLHPESRCCCCCLLLRLASVQARICGLPQQTSPAAPRLQRPLWGVKTALLLPLHLLLLLLLLQQAAAWLGQRPSCCLSVSRGDGETQAEDSIPKMQRHAAADAAHLNEECCDAQAAAVNPKP